MNTIYKFHELTNDGKLVDLDYSEGTNEDENWFKTREAAISWIKVQKSEVLRESTLVLVEMFFT
jgi:hypothetical protein